MNVVEGIVQGSPEWLAVRVGRATASRAGDWMARLANGQPGATRAAYLAELVVESLTGAPFPRFVSGAMLEGIERQPEATLAYAWRTVEEIEQVGFVLHPKIENFGASPDGLVGARGLLEIKCPEPRQHLATLLGEPPKKVYRDQIQAQLSCCPEREWCDFVSYNPLFPEPMRLFVKRFMRNDNAIKEIEAGCIVLLAELSETLEKLRSRYA